MFGRRIFLEPVDNQRDQRRLRSNEFIRQFSTNQGHGIPFTELTSIPYLRNDGLMLDLNLIFVEDNGRVQPNNLYFQTNYGNPPNRYLLEYIRQMEERYLTMEKELTRAKMLIPLLARNTNIVHKSSQTDVNWKECPLTKYEHFLGTCSRNRYIKNQEHINASSRRKQHVMRKNKDSIGKSFANTNWTKYKNSFRNLQNLQNYICPVKEPDSHSCRPKTLSNNSTAVCSMHNVAVILSQDSTQLSDFSRHNRTNYKVNRDIHKAVDKCDSAKIIFGNSRKCIGPFESEKTSMEVCQSLDEKHEPETAYYTNFDVKHEDHLQAKPSVNKQKFRPIMKPKLNNDISKRKSEVEQCTFHRQKSNTDSPEKCIFKRMEFLENTNMHRNDNSHISQTSQGNRNCWNNYAKKSPYERTRTCEKQKRDVRKKTPTPRSNVHTAYTPMVQSSTWNPILDPNGFTIQLLRLAVLLYAPALMPALNSLIARQSTQTTIPISCCSEDSNDLFAQVFTILNSQQCVPNLPYVPNSRINESSRSRESNLQNLPSYPDSHSKNLSKQLGDDTHNTKIFLNHQFEKNSIAVNTSLEICNCNSMKQSSSQYSKNSKNTLQDQTEENEKSVYAWTNERSKSSETIVLGKTMMQCEQTNERVLKKKQECCELSENLLIQEDINIWDQIRINDIWNS